jgi:hypothetical protein
MTAPVTTVSLWTRTQFRMATAPAIASAKPATVATTMVLFRVLRHILVNMVRLQWKFVRPTG